MFELGKFHYTITYTDSGGDVRPAASQSVQVYKAGATVGSTTVVPAGTPTAVPVKYLGRVTAGSVIQLGTSSSLVAAVQSIDWSAKTATLLSGVGFTANEGDRLVVISPTVVIYDDDSASASATNPITTDANGIAQGFILEDQVDFIASGGLLAAPLLVTDVPIQQPRYTAAKFNLLANGTTDQSSKFQAALNEINLRGGGTLELPVGTFALPSGVTIPSNVSIRGAGRTATYLKQTSATSTDLLTIAAGTTNVRLDDLGLTADAGNTGKLINIEDSTASNSYRIFLTNLSLSNGAYGVWSGGDTYMVFIRDTLMTNQSVANVYVEDSYGTWCIDGCMLYTSAASAVGLRIVCDPTSARGNFAVTGHTRISASGAGAKALDLDGASAAIALEGIVLGPCYISSGTIDFTYANVQLSGATFASLTWNLDAHSKDHLVGTYSVGDDYVVVAVPKYDTQVPPHGGMAIAGNTGLLYLYDGVSWKSVAVS